MGSSVQPKHISNYFQIASQKPDFCSLLFLDEVSWEGGKRIGGIHIGDFVMVAFVFVMVVFFGHNHLNQNNFGILMRLSNSLDNLEPCTTSSQTACWYQSSVYLYHLPSQWPKQMRRGWLAKKIKATNRNNTFRARGISGNSAMMHQAANPMLEL